MEGRVKKTPGYCTRPGRREQERQQHITNNAIDKAMAFIAVEKKEYRIKKTYDRTFWGMRVQTGGKLVPVKEKTFKPVYFQPQQQQQVQLRPDPKFYYDALDGMVLNNGTVLSRNDLVLTFDKSIGNATYLGFKNGKHHVNFDIEDFEITKGNLRALAIHEIYGHGIMGFGDKTNDHYKAYWASIDSRYWSATTDQFRTHTAEGLWLTWTRAGNYYEGMPTKYMNVILQYHPAFKR